MAINQLIAQGIAPIGRDVPQVMNMLAQRDIAQRGAAVDEQNAANYQNSLSQQGQARAAAAAEATRAKAIEWATNAVGTVRQNPALIPQFIAQGKQQGLLPPETPDQATPEQVEEFAMRLGIPPKQAATPYSVTEQPGPFGSRIVTDGKRFDVVAAPAPRAAAAGAAPAAQVRSMTPEEVKAAGYPAGTVVQRKPDGTDRVVYKPPAGAAAADAKMRQIAATKIPQLAALGRRMERLQTAVAAIADNPLFTGGVVSGKALPYTDEGKELQSAVSQIQPMLLPLIRVPGVGSQSDLEARLDALQYPSADLPAETNAKNAAEIGQFVEDVQSAYQALLQGGNAAPADDGWTIEEEG